MHRVLTPTASPGRFSCWRNVSDDPDSALTRPTRVDGEIRVDNVCYAIFLRGIRSVIDSHIPHGYPGHTYGVWGVILKQLWGCQRSIYVLTNVFLEEHFHATKPRSTYFSGQEPPAVGCWYISGENRASHLTYVPGTHLHRGDMSKSTTKYDFSTFTKGFPKISKIGHQMRNEEIFPILAICR